MNHELLDLLGHRHRWAVATVLGYLLALSVLMIAALLAQVADIFEPRALANIAATAGAPILGIALTKYAPQPDRLRVAITSAVVYCFSVVAFIAWPVAGVLAQKSPELSWARELARSDMTWLVGPIIGALALACLTKIVTNGTEGFTRARGAALGDARWLCMTEASKLFPPDGEVVIGEAFRPDQERTGHQAFDPGNKHTWGSGGLASY